MASKLLLAAALLQGALSAPVVEERQSCAAQWGQCGGNNWTGPTCCVSGTVCSVVNEWYHQCLAGSAPPGTTTISTSRTTTSATTSRSTTTSGGVTTTTTSGPTPTVTGGAGTTASFTGNPFVGVNMWANAFYSSEIHTLAMPSLTPAQQTAAAKVAQVPSFQWMDIAAKVDTLMAGSLADIRAANKAGGNYGGQFVVYDLPDRDCAAAASNGEYSIADGGVAKYKAYVDAIRRQLIAYSDIRVVLVIEPDSLANMVTNMGVAKCSNAAPYYNELVRYAVTQLNLANVAMYLDAGHAGWLGWPANIQPAATLFAKVYTDTGKPRALRGLVTNVSNYNGWSLSSAPSYATSNPNFDEKRFVEAFTPLLKAAGWDDPHFITDQGRSGKQPTGQIEWGHWCNALGTGFGVRPTTNTGLAQEDALVWVKPGGESDGTSDTSAVRYDHFCGSASSFKPAPEAGQWFQGYFVQLLTNANPAF